MTKSVTSSYLEGIQEGRATFRKEGMVMAKNHLANLRLTIATFSASSPVGQFLRGERDFWINQIKKSSAVVHAVPNN